MFHSNKLLLRVFDTRKLVWINESMILDSDLNSPCVFYACNIVIKQNTGLGSAPTTYFYGRVGSLPHKSRKFLVVSGRVGSLFWSCFWSYFGRFFKWNFKRFLTVLRHIWQCFISYGPEQALECLLTRLKDDIKVLPVQIQYFTKTRLYSLRSLSPTVLKI